MLRLKAALLIRIISRQKQYTESEEEWERADLRAIIVFKRHYEIALANEMRGYARAYAQIEIYWKIENTFSYSSRPSAPKQRVRPTFCRITGLYRPRGASAYTRRPRAYNYAGRFEGDSRNRFAPGVKIASFLARAYPLSSCVEKSIERWRASGNAPMKPLIYCWSSRERES